MNDLPMNSIALGDGYCFTVDSVTYKLSRIEYDGLRVVSLITPPHPLAAATVEQHVKRNGTFSPEAFFKELKDVLKGSANE